jgi:molybdopterin synthase catalytic subunit
VRYLEYEAYPEMAEEVLQQIAGEIRERWRTIRDVAIVHRVGRLERGETSVVIALSAAHREEVFDAVRYAVDRLKEVAPIWKKEVWTDGAEWRSEQ